MIHLAKDHTLKTYAAQEALKSRGLYTGELDNWHGPRTDDALAALKDLLFPQEEPTHRTINQAGLDLVKHFEGLYLKAYKDPVGIWTIGYGHTGLTHRDGTVYSGRTITAAQAEELLRYDMEVFEKRVARFIDVPLSDNEFSALVSFDFNTGGLGDSTLRRKLNSGDRLGAADEFPRWNKAGGKVLAGLTRRRAAERQLFLSPS